MSVSTALIAQGAMVITIEICTGKVDRVGLARTKRPPRLSSLPCQGEKPRDLIDQRLQSHLRDSVDGERDPEVGTWEFSDRARENGVDQGDLLVRAIDGIDMTLGEVRCKARSSFEKGQHPLDDPKVEFDRREESDHIIRIE
jgi:hypothetical protein